MKRNNIFAFTLVELLVVTVMLSVICLAVYSTFSSGSRIWQRVNRMSSQEDLNIFFDRFSADVKNSVNFTGLKFSGMADRCELPTLVLSQALEAKTVGMAIYTCTPGTLSRAQTDYSQIYQDITAAPRHSVRGLESCNFTYYQYDPEKKEYSWVEEWGQAGLPLAVRLSLAVKTDTGVQSMIKTVGIPVGRRGKNE